MAEQTEIVVVFCEMFSAVLYIGEATDKTEQDVQIEKEKVRRTEGKVIVCLQIGERIRNVPRLDDMFRLVKLVAILDGSAIAPPCPL